MKPFIIENLKAHYGIEAVGIEPLSIGADAQAALYKVLASDQKTYFLKIKQGPVNTDILKLLANIKEVIQPLKTLDGKLSQQVDKFIFIVYPFINGQDGFSRELTDHQWMKLGRVLKQIHELQIPEGFSIRREDFSPKWRDTVRLLFTRSEEIPILQFLKEKRALVERITERAEQLSKRAKPQKNVFCHSDIHGGNVLLEADSLYIVDWDDPILAPKERDLMFIGGGVANVWNKPREIELFYKGYGQVDIDQDLLSYYRYERIVQDIAEFAQFFLDSTSSSKDSEIMYKHFLDMFVPNGVVDIAIATDPS